MIKFCDYQIRKSSNKITLTANYFYDPSCSEPKSFVLGTPKCWDDAILDRLPINEYINYHIFSYVLRREKVTRITDYKKVWGLNRIKEGVFSNYYDTNRERIYFGVDISYGIEGFRTILSPTILLIPHDSCPASENIFNCFNKLQINFSHEETELKINQIQQMIPNSIILHYAHHSGASLTIYGDNVDSIFDSRDCLIWEKSSSEQLCRFSNL